MDDFLSEMCAYGFHISLQLKDHQLYQCRVEECLGCQQKVWNTVFPKNYVSSVSFVLSVHQWSVLVMSVSHGDVLLQK